MSSLRMTAIAAALCLGAGIAPAATILLPLNGDGDGDSSDGFASLNTVWTIRNFLTARLGGGSEERIILKFDATAIPDGATVTDVTLFLEGIEANFNIGVHFFPTGASGGIGLADFQVENEIATFDPEIGPNIVPLNDPGFLDGLDLVDHIGLQLRELLADEITIFESSEGGGTATGPRLQVTFQEIPLPASLPLLLAGLGALALRRR